MDSFRSVPFLRFIPAFVLGIIFAFFSFAASKWVLLSAITFSPFLIWLYFSQQNYRYRFLFGLLIQLFFFTCGFLLVSLKENRTAPTFCFAFSGKIKEHVVRNGRQRAEVIIDKAWDGKKLYTCMERILIYLPKDAVRISYNDNIFFTGVPEVVNEVRNPGEFDWKFYLATKRIQRQLFLSAGKYLIRSPDAFSLRRQMEGLRVKLLACLSSAGMDEQENALISALVLGFDDEINSDVMTAFSATGTLHVLSVSGMHVALIYSVISFLLKFLEKWKSGRRLRLFLLLFFIWVYAMITGFSPSVVRSSMMFTVVLLAGSFSKKSNVYNSLLASSFLIFLVIDPLMIFYPGFQLSIMAVAGIVYLYPMISSWYRPSNIILGFFWSIVAVSLAAQLGTLPISLFYFHQFPNYFLLSNIVILPLSTLLIFSGIALILISPWPFISSLLGMLINEITKWMLKFAFFIRDLPFSVTSDLIIDLPEMTLMYISILFLILFLEQRVIKRLHVFLISIIVLFGITIFRYSFSRSREEVIVFSSNKQLAFAHLSGYTLWMYYSGDDKCAHELVQKYISCRRAVFRIQTINLDHLCRDSYQLHENYLATQGVVFSGSTRILVNSSAKKIKGAIYLKRSLKGYPMVVIDGDTLNATKKAIVLPIDQLKRSDKIPVVPARIPFSV